MNRWKTENHFVSWLNGLRIWVVWWRKSMHADHVEFSWDASKSSWLIRIEAGEEVIRRHCALPKSADEQTLRTAIEKAVAEEGYELDPASLIRR
jgi:hypothetical protein